MLAQIKTSFSISGVAASKVMIAFQRKEDSTCSCILQSLIVFLLSIIPLTTWIASRPFFLRQPVTVYRNDQFYSKLNFNVWGVDRVGIYTDSNTIRKSEVIIGTGLILTPVVEESLIFAASAAGTIERSVQIILRNNDMINVQWNIKSQEAFTETLNVRVTLNSDTSTIEDIVSIKPVAYNQTQHAAYVNQPFVRDAGSAQFVTISLVGKVNRPINGTIQVSKLTNRASLGDILRKCPVGKDEECEASIRGQSNVYAVVTRGDTGIAGNTVIFSLRYHLIGDFLAFTLALAFSAFVLTTYCSRRDDDEKICRLQQSPCLNSKA